MPTIYNQPLNPLGVQQSAVNISRQAEVIIIKRMRNIPPAGLDGEADSVEGLKKFDEFIRNGLMVENKSLENRDGTITSTNLSTSTVGRVSTNVAGTASQTPAGLVAGQTAITALRNLYFQITTGASVSTPTDPGTSLNLIPNQDVSTISVDSTTVGSSSASISIRNPQNKYVHKQNPMYVGKPVFESDDIIYINLPGLDNSIYRVFTGFVTTIDTVTVTEGGTLQNYITLECEDMMKRLRESRTNVKPGFIAAEARRTPSAYDVSFADKLPHEILAEICTFAYCDFESIPGVYDTLFGIRQGSVTTKGADAAAKAESDVLAPYAKVPVGSNTSQPFLVTNGEITTQVPLGTVGAVPTAVPVSPGSTTADTPVVTTISKVIPRQIFGFREAQNPVATKASAITSAVNSAVPVKGISNQFPIDDLSFVIEGTSQPIYSQQFNPFGIERWISEWKSSAEVASQIAEAVNFELFTTVEGVLWFRPLNIFLPADVPYGTTSEKVTDQQPRVGTEYWLDELYIKRESYKDTDRDVFTTCVTLGLYDIPYLNTGLEFLKAGIVVDPLKYQKLGARPAPQQQKLELTDVQSTQAYSRAFLNRINAKARRGSVEYVGDARLRSGNPCYIPHRNSIYYIESIKHDFVAGKGYNMSLALTYGRVPIAVATTLDAIQLSATIVGSNPSLANDLNQRYLFPNPINRLGPPSQLGTFEPVDPITGLSSTGPSEVQRYLQHGPTAEQLGIPSAGGAGPSLVSTPTEQAGDGQLVFNGFVWEDLQVMTFEDMLPDITASQPTVYLSQLLLDQRLKSRTIRSLLQSYSQVNPTATATAATVAVVAGLANAVSQAGVPYGQAISQVAVKIPSTTH